MSAYMEQGGRVIYRKFPADVIDRDHRDSYVVRLKHASLEDMFSMAIYRLAMLESISEVGLGN